MSCPYYGIVTVVGTTDVNAVITDLKRFMTEHEDAGKIFDMTATEPWAFQDKMAVRFTFHTFYRSDWGLIQAFSKTCPTLRFSVQWNKGEAYPDGGEYQMVNGEERACMDDSSRPEIAMMGFLSPNPEFFVPDMGLTLSQRFQYRMKQIAKQLKDAAEILNNVEKQPDFNGVPRDIESTKRARTKVQELAEHAEKVRAHLHLDGVLFPNPSEDAELRAKIDALHPAEKTEKTEPLIIVTDDGQEIPF
jgi:hypothetical protein